MTVKHWGGEAGIAWFNMHIPCSGAWDTMISYMALISTLGMMHGKVLANPAPNRIKKKVSPQVEVILVDNKRWNQIVKNQIKFIEVAKEWMHGCVMENVRKIKINWKIFGLTLSGAYMHPTPSSSALVWQVCNQPSHEQLVSTSLWLHLSFHTLMHWHRSANKLHMLAWTSSALLLASVTASSKSLSISSILDRFLSKIFCHPILLLDSNVLSVIVNNPHFHFISWDETLSLGL